MKQFMKHNRGANKPCPRVLCPTSEQLLQGKSTVEHEWWARPPQVPRIKLVRRDGRKEIFMFVFGKNHCLKRCVRVVVEEIR